MNRCLMKRCFLLVSVALLMAAVLTGCTPEGDAPQTIGKITLVDHMAVSYTHLDVYKRQGI